MTADRRAIDKEYGPRVVGVVAHPQPHALIATTAYALSALPQALVDLGISRSDVIAPLFPVFSLNPSVPIPPENGPRITGVSALGVKAETVSLLQDEPGRPLEVAPVPTETDTRAPPEAMRLENDLFGTGGVNRSLLSETRQSLLGLPGSDAVALPEAKSRISFETGSLLVKSPNVTGVVAQRRTPIRSDTRTRGMRQEQSTAGGSYWVPARADLDTLLGKIDSRIISNTIVVKGPYTSMLGPGFRFVDFELLGSPRYEDGVQWHNSTTLNYLTNGQQWYGRESVWGGGENWGVLASYGHRTGADYDAGGEFGVVSFGVNAPNEIVNSSRRLPTGYKSRDLDVALGLDLSPDSRVEFIYLRLDETDLEFPGLVFDINFLVTDGFELKYAHDNPGVADQLNFEGWYNRTRFEGDTRRKSKDPFQIPRLREALRGDAVTDVDATSAGYRLALSWGEPESAELTIGTDLIYLDTELNDIELGDGQTAAPGARNFPIPASHSADVGVFLAYSIPVSDRLTVRCGGRFDVIATDAEDIVPLGSTQSISEIKQAELDQSFYLWSAFATAECELNCHWTVHAGAGHGQRPPTLTELYATGSFIGSLQRGLTTVNGDPKLDPERLTQLDLGLRGEFERIRFGVNGYYAWINDYIIFDHIALVSQRPFLELGGIPPQDFQLVGYGNTDLATMAGFELHGEADAADWLTAFGTMSFVEGRDHTRRRPSRLRPLLIDAVQTSQSSPGFSSTPPAADLVDFPRSGVDTVEEPLPGIPPLEARVGFRVHEPVENPRWGVEYSARIVDAQTRIAASLLEIQSGGFVVMDVRSYWRPNDELLFTAGVENLADRFYREHLDYRPGRGVFQPGVNFYFGTELTR